MELQLKGKRALITGSNSGIGAGIAKTLAVEGVTVVVHGRDAERCTAVVAEISRAGGQALIALGDVATEAGCAAIGDTVMQASTSWSTTPAAAPARIAPTARRDR